MKNLSYLFILLFLGIFKALDAQVVTSPIDFSGLETEYNQKIERYLKKSKNQRIIAWSLLGGGIGLNIASDLLIPDYGQSSGSAGRVRSSMNLIGGTAVLVSIPMFFVASSSKNKATLLRYGKLIDMASSDVERNSYLREAIEYFQYRGKLNINTGVTLSVVGGAFMIGALVWPSAHHTSFLEGLVDVVVRAMFLVGGAGLELLSIPFYVRGIQLKNTANLIVSSNRIPTVSYQLVQPIVKTGQFISVGIGIPLGR